MEENDETHIIFGAGDSLLFKGCFSRDQLEHMQDIYHKALQEKATCSIGFGSTLAEAYYALKFAKLRKGKNAIVGAKSVNNK